MIIEGIAPGAVDVFPSARNRIGSSEFFPSKGPFDGKG